MNSSRPSSWSLSPDDFDSLAAGAALLGSGGGGDGRIGQNLLSILPPETRVTVVSAEELPCDAGVVHVGTVGSPDVVSERLLDPADFARAAETVADLVGRDIDAIGCIEIGGLNTLISVLVSAHIGVPIVDGDLMGRAFPRIHMTLLSAHGRRSTPLSLVSPSRDVAVLKDGSPRRLEAMLSAIVSSMGGAAALAVYPVLAAELRQIGMGSSLSHCLDIGRAFRRNMHRKTTELTELIGGQLVAEGVVEEVRNGDLSSLTVVNDLRRSAARIDFMDEFLAVTVDGTSVASTPKIIIVVDRTTNRPLRCDEVTRGLSVVVSTLPTIHEWPEGALSLVGPEAFGMDMGED
ncbi:DUF917 family protein [Brevibacterium marinum]|uniref:S-methyl thiohydantoin desulfurase domain-containing protein n=1 Tax=Brevibacterium marinum TaxID=418643 RepID=UPI001438AC59